TPAPAKSPGDAVQAPGPGTGSSVSYSVRPGDTLAALASRLAVPEADRDRWMARVVGLNSLNGPDLLVAGQSLTLPALNGGNATGGSAGDNKGGARTYAVQQGDNLTTIAAKLGIAESDRHDWLAAV